MGESPKGPKELQLAFSYFSFGYPEYLKNLRLIDSFLTTDEYQIISDFHYYNLLTEMRKDAVAKGGTSPASVTFHRFVRTW